MSPRTKLLLSTLAVSLFACAGPTPGPDKQGAGLVSGAVTGAGAGAVTGFHATAATGPGAAIGAGIGAVAGSISGAMNDDVENSLLKVAADAQTERSRSYAQEVLIEHYQRRMELHPTRDIFPADVFFQGDNTKLKGTARDVVHEIIRLNAGRAPWSRFAVIAYVRSNEGDTTFATHLAEGRAKALSNSFVRAGIEPRRIVARAVILEEPILVDPHDDPMRYNQAIELTPLDM